MVKMGGALAHIAAALFLLAILMVSGPARAQDPAYYPIGEIVKIEGEAFLASGKNRKAVKTGDPVFLGTTIETSAASKVLVLLIDDTEITLAENSSFVIDEYVIDPYAPDENMGRFSILKGAFYWVSGLISKREEPDVRIETAIGSIGIRGTEFWAGAIENGHGVFVDEGLVIFEGEWGSAELPSGNGLFIKKFENRLTEFQDFWSATNRNAALKTVTFADTGARAQDLKALKAANIRKRHDYRGQKFPYKPNPLQRTLKRGQEKFFSDEFDEMRENR